MIELHAIVPTDGARLRAVRLRALLDAPSAFGSTHAGVSRWSDADWDRRAAQLAGDRQVGFIAADDDPDLDVGMVAGSVVAGDPARATLISMWVAPAHRRRGVGGLLVSAVAGWARSRRVTTLVLTATSSNAAAIRFYKQLGFAMTGRTEPYPNDPALVELEMVRRV